MRLAEVEYIDLPEGTMSKEKFPPILHGLEIRGPSSTRRLKSFIVVHSWQSFQCCYQFIQGRGLIVLDTEIGKVAVLM